MVVGKRREPIATILRAVGLGGAFLAGILLLAGTARGEGLSGYVEFSFNDRESRSEDKQTDRISRTEGNSFLQRYYLSWFQQIFPNLDYRLGGLFEKVDSTTDNGLGPVDSDLTRLRPFLKINWRTEVHWADLSLDRNQDRRGVDALGSITDVRDTFSMGFSWNPERLPTLSFRYLRTHTYDKRREIHDSTQEGVQFTLDYTFIEQLRVTTSSSVGKNNDNLEGNKVKNTNHAARVTYSDAYLDQRMRLNSDYNFAYRQHQTEVTGEGNVSLPIFPFAGLSVIGDIDETGITHEIVLDNNPALIDGNAFTGAGINLGLPPPGGDDRFRHIGLDFVDPSEVNLFFVFYDRELPLEVATSFSWTIYTSEDNLEWTLHEENVTVDFSGFENRFELLFDEVSARYVKAVTEPLSPTDPLASEYPVILVTELRAFLRRPAADLEIDQTETSHIFNVDFRARLTKRPDLFYEMTYFLAESGSEPSRYTLTNGLSLLYPINHVYTVAARVRREIGQERRGSTNADIYSASLTVTPLPTLRQSVVYSGTNETNGGLDSVSNAVFLLNVLQLYRGIDLNLSAGKTKQRRETSADSATTASTDVKAGLTFIPHRTLSVNLSYRDRQSEVALSGTLPIDQSSKSNELGVAYRPLRSLYFYGSYRVEDPQDRDERTIRDYSFSWSPFPDGTLRFVFNYNESYRSEDDATFQTILPTLRWDITRRAYVDLSYRKVMTDGALRESDEESLSANFRTSF